MAIFLKNIVPLTSDILNSIGMSDYMSSLLSSLIPRIVFITLFSINSVTYYGSNWNLILSSSSVNNGIFNLVLFLSFICSIVSYSLYSFTLIISFIYFYNCAYFLCRSFFYFTKSYISFVKKIIYIPKSVTYMEHNHTQLRLQVIINYFMEGI